MAAALDGLCETCARPGTFWLYKHRRSIQIVCEAHGQAYIGALDEGYVWGRLDRRYPGREELYMPEVVPDNLPRRAYRDR